MQPIRIDLDQDTYVRLVNSAFDEDRTIPTQAAELVRRALRQSVPMLEGVTARRVEVGATAP